MIAALFSLVWIIQLYLVIRIVRSVPPLSHLNARTPDRWPRLSIVVPARDEGAQIEAALASKIACGYPELELVAVDDRSTDDTGAILDRAAAADPRVRAVHVRELPDGWLGKLHAMKKGLEMASGDWVLFSDADVHVEPGALERLIAYAEENQIDFIAVFPRMHSVNLVIDAAVALLLRIILLTGRVWSANDDRSRIGMGVGAFNLARRSVLESTRAIDELRMEVADDVALGALLKHSGARTRFFAGRSDIHLVFLDSLRAAIRSADKGGAMFRFSLLLPISIALMPMLFELLLPIGAIAYGGIAASFGIAALIIATLTHVLIAAHFGAPLRGGFLWFIAHPLNAVVMLRTGLRTWKHQGIWWRDTFYPRRVLEAGQRLEVPSMRIIRRALEL